MSVIRKPLQKMLAFRKSRFCGKGTQRIVKHSVGIRSAHIDQLIQRHAVQGTAQKPGKTDIPARIVDDGKQTVHKQYLCIFKKRTGNIVEARNSACFQRMLNLRGRGLRTAHQYRNIARTDSCPIALEAVPQKRCNLIGDIVSLGIDIRRRFLLRRVFFALLNLFLIRGQNSKGHLGLRCLSLCLFGISERILLGIRQRGSAAAEQNGKYQIGVVNDLLVTAEVVR